MASPSSDAAQKLQYARQQWQAAPSHVKKLAGSYVEPVLDALDAIQREIHQLREAQQSIKGTP